MGRRKAVPLPRIIEKIHVERLDIPFWALTGIEAIIMVDARDGDAIAIAYLFNKWGPTGVADHRHQAKVVLVSSRACKGSATPP